MNGRNDPEELDSVDFDAYDASKEAPLFSDPKEYGEPCDKCGGTGTLWTHPQDPQDAIEVDCQECEPSPVPDCLRCHDSGYVRDWRGAWVQCQDCWNDLTGN
jgi:DnaJ-class molecular chaperone